MEISKKTKGFVIASSIIAILTAIRSGYSTFSIMQQLGITRWGNLELLTHYPVIIPWIIGQCIVILSMIMCTVYLLAYYGKKENPIWGFSTALLAGLQVHYCYTLIENIFYLLSRSNVVYVSAEINNIRITETLGQLVTTILTFTFFVLLTVNYFSGKDKINFNTFRIVVVSILLVSITVFYVTRIIVWDKQYFNNQYYSILNGILSHLIMFPFLLVILFCPPPNRDAGGLLLKNYTKVRKGFIKVFNWILFISGAVLWILQLMSIAGRSEWYGFIVSMNRSMGFVYRMGFWLGSNWAGLLGTVLIFIGILIYRKRSSSQQRESLVLNTGDNEGKNKNISASAEEADNKKDPGIE